jgi:hypothetical protein
MTSYGTELAKETVVMWIVFLFTIIYSMSGHVLNYIYIETRKKYFPN